MAEGVAERLDIQQRPNRPLDVPPPLSRPRLLARLRAASAGKATVLRGPAGSGKSRLLADWMHGDGGLCPIPVGPDPQQLWADALAALERHGGAAVLVLDGVDCRPDDPRTDVVAALLAMPGVRLVLSTRTMPFLPLSRFRLAGELVEIEASELAFTPTEAAAVWWRYGVPLSEREAAVLTERTEGWPALVCLAALARVDSRLNDDPLYEFLRVEVYGPQPRPARDLLIRMSQVPAVRADLAEALTGCPDAHRLLDQLRRDGLLVHERATEGPALDSYRLRRPVQEFLRREAELTIPAELVGIRLHAAQWHADHGEPSTAVRLTQAAGDDRRTAQLVTRFAGPLLLGSDRDVLSTLRLPTVEALDDRDVAAALAVVAADRGDAHAAAAYAALITHDAPEDDRDAHLSVATALAELVVARRSEPGPAWRATAAAVIRLLDTVIPGLVPGGRLIEALSWSTRGMAELADGELAEAARSFATAIERADQAGTRIVYEARAGLALLALVQGQPARAVELFELEGSANDGESGPPAAHWASSTCGLGTAVLDWGCWLLGRTPVTPSTVEGASGSAMVVATRARLLVVDDAARADQLLRPYSERAEPLPRLAQEWLALAEADLHLAVGRPVHALTALSHVSHGRDDPLGGVARVMSARAYLASAAPARAASLVAPVQEWPNIGPLIRAEAWLVGALAADAQGHDGTVGIAIAESLAAAAPDGIVAPFLETAVTALLDRHRDLLGRHRAFAAQIVPVPRAGSVGGHPVGDGSRHRVTPPPRNRRVDGRLAPLTEPITAREAVVLRFLPTLLTLNDIARELSVSPNTVKSHLRHIYRKLAVGSRRDAVRQARRFGLLWD